MTNKNSKLECKKVIEYFLAFANSKGDFLTNLKLQKLLYYSQSWYLANYGSPLFADDFEAWIHGPVISKVYRSLKKRGFYLATPIRSEFKIDKIKADLDNIDSNLFPFLEEVARVYFPYGAYELELMTHKEAPWIEARKGIDSNERCTNIIDKRSISDFYGKRIQNKSHKA